MEDAYFKFIIEEEDGDGIDPINVQTVKDETGNIYYEVCDLDDCPEEAVIGRSLFSANDYIAAVRFGIQLHDMGYDDVETSYVNVSD
jgi:hypothetical protein